MAKIMIVDDTAFMRMMLREIITDCGFEVIAEAENGKEAVQFFRQYRPELVTMDITMPEMDGIAALKEIKRIDPMARVIICSAMGQKDRVVDAITSGAADFIVKPFQREKVVETLAKALK
ncbi:chemotaxis protein CheY [Paenibacillus vulneris]|uniref:Response regulator n=1 Tax=Paenibacillus vulneris TaxID=1133364 RepID=A0ABW3UX52_9BACL|nr:response regulator [Paenibacillus ehimensis]